MSLFVSGCPHHCKGCFQPETWNFDYGYEFTYDTLENIVKMLDSEHIEGLTIVGGEPLAPQNIHIVSEIIEHVNECCPDKTIWIYTGYTYEQLNGRGDANVVLAVADVLVDGPFVEELKDITLEFKGSSNQRIIDLQKSHDNEIILWKNQYKRKM